MKLLIKNSVLLLIIYVVLFFSIEKYYDYYFQKKPIENKSNWIMNLKNKNYDYAVIGSSDAFHGLDIQTINSKSGLNGINLAQDGTCLEENLALFKKFYQNKNQAKILLIALFTNDFDEKENFELHSEKYIPYLKDSVINTMVKGKTKPYKYWLWKLVPFAGYAEYNNFYSFKNIITRKSAKSYFVNLDTTMGTEIIHAANNMYEWEDTKIELKQNRALEGFVNFSSKHNIKVVFITMPRYDVPMKHILNRHDFFDMLKTFGVKHNIAYYNFSTDTSVFCKKVDFFRDPAHLTAIGTYSFSNILGAQLNEIIAN